METGFWTIPELRGKFLAGISADKGTAEARAKKQKLSKLAGKGGVTVPQKDPAKMTKQERSEAMTAELADMLARS